MLHPLRRVVLVPVLVGLSTASAGAQSATTDLLSAERVAQRLVVEVTEGNNGEFLFDVARDRQGPHDLNEGQLFAATGPVRVLLRPFKPLKYTYVVKVEGFADENAADLARFAEGLLGLGAALRPDLKELADADSRQMAFAASAARDNQCPGSEVDLVENALTGLDTTLRVRAVMTLSSTFERHADAGDEDSIREAADELGDAAASIQQAVTTAESKLQTLRSARDRLKSNPGCAELLRSVLAVEAGAALRIDNLRVIAATLGALVRGLRSLTRWEDGAYELTRDVHPRPDEGKKVTLTVAKRNFLVSESALVERPASDTTSRTFALRSARSFVPELAAGFVVSSVRQPKYGTGQNEAGETILTRADDETLSFDAALMLNLVCRCGSGGGLFPMFQVGVSPDRDRPAFLGGLGLRFGGVAGLKNVGVAFGGILAFPKDLSKLAVGDVVQGTTEIDADLDFKPTVKPYFTIQYSF